MLLSLLCSSSRAVLSAQAMSGFGETLKMAFKETNCTHGGSSKVNTNRYPQHFPLLPYMLNMCTFFPRQREGKVV